MNDGIFNGFLALIAIVSMIGNMIAFLFAKAELHGQREETAKIARLTASLKTKVNRIAVALDLSITHLSRVRELTSGIIQAIEVISKTEVIDRISIDDYGESDGEKPTVSDEAQKAFNNIETLLIELESLSFVIHDTSLSEKVVTFRKIIRKIETPFDIAGTFVEQKEIQIDEDWVESREIFSVAREIFERTYQLLEQATQNKED